MKRRRSSLLGYQPATMIVLSASVGALLLANAVVVLVAFGASAAAGPRGLVFLGERTPAWLAATTRGVAAVAVSSVVSLVVLRWRDPERTRWWEDGTTP